MNSILVGIAVYILLQLLIGVWLSRRIVNEADYLLAGRSLGWPLATLSVFATWFGAETCIGAAGAVYEQGLSGATVDPFGYASCLVIMGLVFAIPLWRRQLMTLADLFRQRYSRNIEILAVLLLAPGSIMWAAAQIRAFGQVLSASSGLEVEITISIAALVVVVYTMYGGLLADVVTDAVQGVAILLGLLLIAWLVVDHHGGLPATIDSITPERLNMRDETRQSWLQTVEMWAIPICGSVLSQELIARTLASRSPQIAQRACLGGGLLYLLVGLIPVMIGLTGWQLLPDLSEPEQILPQLAQQFLPTFLYIIFAGALISAILSTVDSALLAASALLSHNLLIPAFTIDNERHKILLARSLVMLSGIIAFMLAWHADRVYSLVEEASAFGSAGIFVVVIFGLFTRFGGVYSAAVALLGGIISYVSGHYWFELETPYLLSLAVAFGCYVLSAPWEPGARLTSQ